MFDDQPKNEVVPKNLPVEEPKDMFAGLEAEGVAGPTGGNQPQNFPKALDSGMLKKKADFPPAGSTQDTDVVQTVRSESRSPVTGRILFGVIVLLLLGGLGAGGWWLFSYFKNKPAPEVANNNIQVATKGSESTKTGNSSSGGFIAPGQDVGQNNGQQSAGSTSTEEVKATSESILFGDAKDTDMDDLTDADELKMGTDPKNPDSDGDGITDGDEVKIWKTNPLKRDTDGDGYNDGDEIKNGYNPLGAGKYLNIPMAVIRIVSSTAAQKVPPVFEVITIKVQK